MHSARRPPPNRRRRASSRRSSSATSSVAGDRAALITLLTARSVRFGEFVLASGAKSSWYIDCRLTTMSAPGQVLIGPLGLDAIRLAGWEPDAIGGLTMGADPVAYA